MGEPNTYKPIISVDRINGVLTFEIQTEGLSISFDMDGDELPGFISRLEDIQEQLEEFE